MAGVTTQRLIRVGAESYDYRQRTGRSGENEDLFPSAVVEWASQHIDDLSMLELELEETPDLIRE